MASLRAALAGDGLVLCLALTHARTPDFPLIAAAAGYDAVYVDLEHASTSWDSAAMLCTVAAGAGLASLVRVPSHDADVIARGYDIGAHGVICPHVQCEAEAKQLVGAAHFPPRGDRSLSGPNAVTGYGASTTRGRLAALGRENVLVAMIESAVAVESAAAIAQVEGIDLLLVGPHDLSADLGMPGEVERPEVVRAVDTVAAACRAAGIPLGIAGVRSQGRLASLVERGLRFISAGTDAGLFGEAATARAAELRSLDPAAVTSDHGRGETP